MSSLPNSGRSTSRDRHDSNLITPSSSVHEHDTASELRSTPNPNLALTGPATRATSHQPSESSGTTLLSASHDGGAVDNASSVTLQDEVGVNKYIHSIPPIIVPDLLQATTSVSPSRSSSDGEDGGARQVDEESSNSEDVVPRYSASQKGKWKARTNGDILCGNGLVGPLSPQFHFYNPHNPVEEWVAHSRPILQDYADRQTSLPLGTRLEVTIDEPPKFILGAIQLLVNRDASGRADRSWGLGPQLIENFVDIDRWAKEYFRSRHGTHVVDSDVPALLTIVMNNFYEGQVQLIDRLVEFAFRNMHFCGRSSLGIEDFAFGFDFTMSQDLPFYVETSSRIREPLPIPAVEIRPTQQVKTTSGRPVKLTKRAQAATEQANERRNRENNSSEVKDKQAVKITVPPARQKKNSSQASSQHLEAPVTSQGKPHAASPALLTGTSEHTRNRVARPSNLGVPLILPTPSSTVGGAPVDDRRKSEPVSSASATRPQVSGSGSNLTVDQPVRLTIKLPPLRLPTSMARGTSGSDSTSSTTNSLKFQLNPPANASGTTNKGRGAPRTRGACPRGSRNRGRGRGRERRSTSENLSTETHETTVVNSKALSTVHPVDERGAEASTAVSLPAASSSHVDTCRSSVGISTRTQSRGRGVDDSTDTQNDRPSMSRHARTGHVLPLQPTTGVPGHSKAKKRKLDDCED